ncbi:small subunit ribosomal protein S16 [Lachnospiraceae bacterium NK3A20]|jgi:small subunit ribosomal protein S16|nr:small subunit ribosomal protein S16 [Lachnospiraceae bacterium NK3A20]
MVKIRLARIGKKKFPVYRVVVQEASNPRNGVAIDQVGFYDPNTEPATINMDLEKVNSWIARGAQPTTVVKKLVKAAKKAN